MTSYGTNFPDMPRVTCLGGRDRPARAPGRAGGFKFAVSASTGAAAAQFQCCQY